MNNSFGYIMKIIRRGDKILFFSSNSGHRGASIAPAINYIGVINRSDIKFRYAFILKLMIQSFLGLCIACFGLILLSVYFPSYVDYYMIVFLPVVVFFVFKGLQSYDKRLDKFSQQFVHAKFYKDVDDVDHNRFWRERRWSSLKALNSYDAFVENCVLLVELSYDLQNFKNNPPASEDWVSNMENLVIEYDLEWKVEKHTESLENFVKLSNTVVRF